MKGCWGRVREKCRGYCLRKTSMCGSTFLFYGHWDLCSPSLGAGATIGSMIAHIFELTAANTNLLILSGMVGFLTGVTRSPFTSAILVLEMTDRHNVIFHLMLAGMTASL